MRPPSLPRGRLDLDPTVYLAPGAIVCGEVKIGAHSSVWFNSVVRGDSDRIVIGERTNVQDLSVIHMDEDYPALIGDRVTIGHRVIVHGCVIENDCLIGMGAILLTGSRIGTGSLVGAGTLVREGQVIPPGSLVVGSPARIVGEVKPAHREAIERGWAHYEALARDYRLQEIGQKLPGADGAVLG